MESWDTQLRKGGLELAVLLLLSRRRMYGLELLTGLKEAGFSVSEGTIYPLLNRLAAQSVITAEWVTGDSGHPRKYYRLTGIGHEQSARMTRQWNDFTSSMENLINHSRFAADKGAQQKGVSL